MASPASPGSAKAGLDLLLCDADAGQPALARPLATRGAVEQGRLPKPALPKLLWNEGGDANSLPEQRWGLVLPEGEDEKKYLDWLDPLVKHRQAQQGTDAVKIYRAPAKADGPEAMAWRKTHFDDEKDTREDLPRYLLIAGNLDQVALSIQQALAIDAFVGRLAFDSADPYRAYAEKVVRYERAEPRSEPSRASFFTVHDGTQATTAGYESLVSPGLALAERKRMERRFPAREVAERGDKSLPTREELLSEAASPDPSVLFTLSHGAGAPTRGWKSAADQRLRQGAMSFGSDGLLLGRDLASRPFLPGGMWFMLACYSAGTPDTSSYHHWLERLSQLGEFSGLASTVLAGLPKPGERPFIASLPQQVLQNPEGPLAFMGHIDLAWTYSFSDLDSGAQVDRPARFIQLVGDLLRGNRVGVAFRSLMQALGATNSELATLYDQQALLGGNSSSKQEARRGHLWMLRQDLAAYVVLGDPAARLPIREQPPATAKATLAPSTAALSGGAAQAVPAATAASFFFGGAMGQAPDRPPLDVLERAIAQVILDPQRLNEVAVQSGLSPGELRTYCERFRQAGRAAIR